MQKWWTKKETLRLPDFIILMVRPSVITLTLSKFNVSFVVHVCFLVGTSCWSITLMFLLFYRAMIFKGEISCWSFSLPCGPEFRFLSRVMTISFRLKTHVLSITSQVWTLFPVEWDGFNLYTFTKDDTYNKTLDPFQLCWLTGSPRTLQVISLRDHNRILGGRNLVRVRNIVVAAIFDLWHWKIGESRNSNPYGRGEDWPHLLLSSGSFNMAWANCALKENAYVKI